LRCAQLWASTKNGEGVAGYFKLFLGKKQLFIGGEINKLLIKVDLLRCPSAPYPAKSLKVRLVSQI